MIRIILVSGLAIGTATGGAVALALAHDGLFARSGTPVDRKPLAAIALPEPAPMVASVTALTAATDMEWDSAAQDIYNTSQEAVSPIRPEDHQKPDKAGLVTLSTSGPGRTMPAEDAKDIDASYAEFDGSMSPYAIEPRRAGRADPTVSHMKRSVDFSPLSTGVYR